MAKTKRGGASDKSQYTRYKSESRCEKNKRIKITRHIKNNPNDKVAALAIKAVSYSRHTPKATTQYKSKANKRFAHMIRILHGNAKHVDRYFSLERSVYDRPARD